MEHRKLLPHHVEASAIRWPTFRGKATLVGSATLGISVYVDASLGAGGLACAQSVMADADGIARINNFVFGIHGGSVNALVMALDGATDGSGGADHMACTFKDGGNIEVCAAYHDHRLSSALLMAELSECAMNGELCGYSTGEALSRWCSMLVYGKNMPEQFLSAPVWDQDHRLDWITRTEQTDGEYDSIGCGMAFISWLLHRGHTIDKIAAAMVYLSDEGTLEELQNRLLESGSFASDLPDAILNDDPFGSLPSAIQSAGGELPLPVPPPAPAPPPSPARPAPAPAHHHHPPPPPHHRQRRSPVAHHPQHKP